MKQLRIEELLETIQHLQHNNPLPQKVAEKRFKEICRMCYGITRDILSMEDVRISNLLTSATEKVNEEGAEGGAASLLLFAFCHVVDLQQRTDRELFKEQLIAGLDEAVQYTGHAIQAHYDSRTKQSTS